MNRIGIVVALPAEARSLSRKRPRLGVPIALDPQRLLILSGVGPKAAARAARALIHEGISGLVSWGCAAGLSPDLHPGDLTLPTTVLSPSGESLPTALAWHRHVVDRLSTHLGCYQGILTSHREVVASSHVKQDIHGRTGAIALDMESAAVAQTAREYDLPFLVIRAVADPASMSLPGAVLAGIDDTGAVKIPRVLTHAIKHPKDFVELFRLNGCFRAAVNTLTVAASRLGTDLAL